ncbi:MAG: MBL fold metallo-hydrolase [Bacteroidetes bacterium GWD2_45_23]|nr:MAG: MBL fold metallo-hydrolase [Bacteroidetes bacterium GWC2_46_850]OFX78999.1 MAG: MBL fold metallo-hydrolase [Bacteroidetes bacterium GWC1_47_7]OFX82956.1 MAG: MBL fold metallo-hydrolase [Bacteroidetes bacterium GWD2_45_23]HAR37709.1 MBL fold metallo-hydrolase [Porphyromonadaceae bacterium]HBA99901.1 MBL fold metallo-hydrolase [Porphyromonadaceae bacterium]
MQYKLFQADRISFFSLSSGSCGNCYYLGNAHYGILIDAGLGPRVIRKRLAEHGIELSSIMAILITHDHYDHIKSAGYLGEKLHIPVYATREVHRGISNCPMIHNNLNGSTKYIEKGKPFQIEDFKITAFDVPHDSNDNAGYFFEFDGQRMTLATDVGAITDEVAFYICKANHLVIESNYDEEMLQNGRYPWHLKRRITSGTGHLSNRQTAEFLANNFTSDLRNIWLCHLSGDNNNPELAFNTTKLQLSLKGIEVGRHVALHVLERNILSPKVEF